VKSGGEEIGGQTCQTGLCTRSSSPKFCFPSRQRFRQISKLDQIWPLNPSEHIFATGGWTVRIFAHQRWKKNLASVRVVLKPSFHFRGGRCFLGFSLNLTLVLSLFLPYRLRYSRACRAPIPLPNICGRRSQGVAEGIKGRLLRASVFRSAICNRRAGVGIEDFLASRRKPLLSPETPPSRFDGNSRSKSRLHDSFRPRGYLATKLTRARKLFACSCAHRESTSIELSYNPADPRHTSTRIPPVPPNKDAVVFQHRHL
jgi:hypothetical protein